MNNLIIEPLIIISALTFPFDLISEFHTFKFNSDLCLLNFGFWTLNLNLFHHLGHLKLWIYILGLNHYFFIWNIWSLNFGFQTLKNEPLILIPEPCDPSKLNLNLKPMVQVWVQHNPRTLILHRSNFTSNF